MPVQTYPLGPPTVSGNLITVDTALQQPTRITRMIMDLTLQRFFVDRVFASEGGVTGGAVVFDQATLNDLYIDPSRDVERVEPGAEFPQVTTTRPAPQVALVEKWGGKFDYTDEAADRNDVALFTNSVRKLANTIVRKINQRGVEVLEAAITAQGGASNTTGTNWSTVVTAGSTTSSNQLWPAADFAKAQLIADQRELGVTYDLWIVNPVQRNALAVAYGDRLDGVLASNGISMFATNRVANGTAYAVAAGQVGGMRVEQPLATEVWRDEGKQKRWVQSSVRPVMYVTDPFSVLKFTGLNG